LGVIEADGISGQQVLDSENSTAYNYGIIEVDGYYSAGQQVLNSENSIAYNYELIRVKGNDSYGMLADGNETTIKNYGQIEVYNEGLSSGFNIGMYANEGKAYNYGVIKLDVPSNTLSTVTTTNGTLEVDGTAMAGNGELYNYGQIEVGTLTSSRLANYKLGRQFASTKSKYKINAETINLDGKIKILPEAGIGKETEKKNFIYGGAKVVGLDNIVASNKLYNLTTHVNKTGGVDLKLIRNQTVKLDDNLTWEARKISKGLNLDEVVTNSSSYLNNFDTEVANYIMDEYNSGKLKEVVLNDLNPKIYTELNSQILDMKNKTKELSNRAIFATKSNIQGKIFKKDGGSGKATFANLAKVGDYKLSTSVLYEKLDSVGDVVNYNEKKVGGSITLSNNEHLTAKGYGFTYLHNDISFENSKGEAKTDRLAFDYSKRTLKNGIGIKYGLGLGINFHDYERNIDFLRDKRVAKSDFKSYDASINAELFKNYQYKRLVFTPYIGISSSLIHREKFTEKGANSLNANFSSSSKYSLKPKIGLATNIELLKKDNQSLSLDSSFNYSIETGNIAYDGERVKLKGFDGSYNLGDPIKEKSSFNVETNLKYKVNDLELSLGYSNGDHSKDRVTAGFSYSW